MAYSSPEPNDLAPLLQQRVTRLLTTMAALLTLFFVYGLAEPYLSDEPAQILTAGTLWHAAAIVMLGILALWSWRFATTVRRAYAADATGMVLLSVLIGLVFSNVHTSYRPEMTMLTSLTLSLMARSAFVPSTARRTAIVCALAGVPLLALTWHIYSGLAPRPGAPAMTAVGVTVYVTLWWAASAGLAVSVSHVIYGLRREIDRAKRLGQYTLEEKLGEGGMGQVYRARHALLRRPTAIKLLLNAGQEQLRRFEREVQLTASLTHPNTIAVFDYGHTPDGIFYYAMEYLDGLNLDELVQDHGAQPAGRVIHILTQVCEALAEAHSSGLIHRDIKPANIILCQRGGVADMAKVLDFGLVKDIEGAMQGPDTTAHNVIMGTPLYLSPEAIKEPDAVDGRSDIYALGAVGYWMISGRTVFEGGGIVEICGHHLHTPPEPPSKHVASVPADIERILLRCLAKDPAERPADVSSLATELSQCAAAGDWTRVQAAAWWQTHAPAKRPRDAAPTHTPETVAIDLSARRNG